MQEESEREAQALSRHYSNPQVLSSFSETGRSVPKVFSSPLEASSFVQEQVDSVLFDCDGVIYRTPDPAPGARQCIQNLIAQGKQLFFVTNNASASRLELKNKLESILEMPGQLKQEMMVGSAFSAAQYLKQTILDKQGSGCLYVIGSAGLRDELCQTGFEVLDSSTEPSSMSRDELAEYDFPQHAIDAVVVGHDTNLSFRKLCIANVLLQRNPTAPLVATNLDSYDLVGLDARHIPGNGGAVRFLEHCSQRQAVNCGKPSPVLANLLDSLYGLDRTRALFVGDRLDTDIRFGVDTGMHTVLVMTGVTGAKDMINLVGGTVEEPLPGNIVPHIGYLA